MFDRRFVRLALIGGVGLYLFLLCAAYLSRKPVEPQPSFAVLGPEVVEPGGTFPVRVVSYQHGGTDKLAATITAAFIDDGVRETPVQLDAAAAGIPAVAHIGPAPKREGPFVLRLAVANEAGDERDIQIPLVVYYPKIVDDPGALRLPEAIPPDTDLLVEILPEGPGLALAMKNRLWFRITDRAGGPVSGATVKWSSKSTDPPGGEVETDAAGLADVDVTASNLVVRFEVQVSRDELRGKLQETHDALGLGVLIRIRRMLETPSAPNLTIAVARADSNDPAYCDLYRGDAWIRTWHFAPLAGETRVTAFPVDLPEPDTYRLQCYTHYVEPGDGADALWLFGRDEPRIRAVSRLVRGDPRSPSAPLPESRSAAYRRKVPVIDEPGRRAVLSNYRTRRIPVTSPALVAGTRSTDLAEAKLANDRIRIRFFLLIGASFGLIILWALYTAIHAAIENRTRLAAAVADLGDLAVEIKPPTNLMRLRRGVQYAMVIVVLILNVVAMLELFRYM